MLDKNVSELLNTQINKEFYSAYLYLDFANYYKDQDSTVCQLVQRSGPGGARPRHALHPVSAE